MHLLEALLLQSVTDSCHFDWVVAGQLKEAAEAEQHVLKAVAGMFLQATASTCRQATN
jgi:hypothetical protein